MKRSNLLIVISLLVSLFIYLFYRTEKTVVNEMVVWLISKENYLALRTTVNNFLPLSKPIIYSLPEGLWVFCITLTSKFFYIPVFSRRIDGVFVPLIYAVSLEIFQLVKITKGHFDILDILISLFFWFLSAYFFTFDVYKQNILKPINSKSIYCFASYGIVYLSHVLE